MFSETRKRAKKAGQPPGTATYTGDHPLTDPVVEIITYNKHDYHEVFGQEATNSITEHKETGLNTWVSVEGLRDVELIKNVASSFDLHPLTIEDVLNVEQRPKVEEFDNYLFITLKMLHWQQKSLSFSVKQVSIVLGKDFVLTFQESNTTLFDNVKDRLKSTANQRLRQHGADYLAYRLIDMIVDQYFVVLEALGDQIEKIEELILDSPTPQNMRSMYRLKRQMLLLRKAVWPMREAISHLVRVEDGLVTAFTRIYLRDVYDHTVQAIDTLETFRDMLGTMMDVYLSSLTNRMNEVMKTLTIIATIFMPITTLASIYGMNFTYMPELNWHWGYYTVLCVMLAIAAGMMTYFWRKKWV